MADTIVIYHDEFALSIGIGEDGPAPDDLLARLLPKMTYTHVDKCSRHEMRDPISGEIRKYKFEQHNLYRMEHPVPRLSCQPGYLDRVISVAEELGYVVDVRDLKFTAYADSRPDAFVEDWDRYVEIFKPRVGQDDVITQIADHTYGIVEAAPGYGKSYLMAALSLVYPNAEILVVVPSEAVLQTVYTHASTYLPANQIGLIGGGNRKQERFTICIINSLLRQAWAQRPDIIAADEAHLYTSTKFAEAIAVAARRSKVFGFSGSMVKKFNGDHARAEGLFGRTIFKFTNQDAVANGLVVPIQVIWHPTPFTRNPAARFSSMFGRKRNGIWYHTARNQLIADVARQYAADVPVLVLVETVTHALELAKLLPDYHICVRTISEALEENVLATADFDRSRLAITDAERRKLIDDFMHGRVTKLLATDILGTGFSANALSVLIRADARKSEVKSIQLPGRVARTHSGKLVGTVHDFADTWDSGFMAAAHQRRRDYEKRGFVQIKTQPTALLSV